MNTFSFIRRYSFSRYNRHFASSLKIAISFSLSMAVLIVILSVMQMLQTSRFDAIRDVKSFDITIKGASLDEVKVLYPDESVFRYKEGYALIDGNAYCVRYIDSDYDGGVDILFGTPDGMLIPYGLYMHMKSPSLDFSTISRVDGRSIPISRKVEPSGVYTTSLSSFDSYYVFMPYDSAPAGCIELVAVKGSEETGMLEERGIGFETWKEKERTLYSAFALESFMMFLVLLILLLIVYVEILGEARVFLRNKRKERLELRILGMAGWRIDLIFISSFLLILFFGLVLSVLLQEVGARGFSYIMHSSFSLYKDVYIDYSLFFLISIVFLFLTAITVYILLRRNEGKSIMEELHD